MSFSINIKGKYACDECNSTFLYTSIKTGVTVCFKCGQGSKFFVKKEKKINDQKPPLIQKLELIMEYVISNLGSSGNYPFERFKQTIMVATNSLSSKTTAKYIKALVEFGYICSPDTGRIVLSPKSRHQFLGEPLENPEFIKNELDYIDKMNSSISPNK